MSGVDNMGARRWGQCSSKSFYVVSRPSVKELRQIVLDAFEKDVVQRDPLNAGIRAGKDIKTIMQ